MKIDWKRKLTSRKLWVALAVSSQPFEVSLVR